MKFACKKVYVNRSKTRKLEDITLDDDDFGGEALEMSNTPSRSISNRSSRSSNSRRRRRSRSRSKESVKERKKKVVVPQQVEAANTNVVSVELKCIVDQGELMTGDATHCENCGACFSYLSKITIVDDEQLWNCEYCESPNVVFIDDEEIPKTGTSDYIVKPADQITEIEEETIIFVVDTSGSMCVTTEIQGKHNFKAGKSQTDILSELNVGLNNQYLPGQRRDVSYVSRLQCVQTAIASQLEVLSVTQPNSKVGLVCFNNEVNIIGDGIQSPVTVAGDRLHDKDKLLQIGSAFTINSAIGECKDSFLAKMYGLNEGGATALGPAVLVAIGMAQQAKIAKIVIATDGLANIGIGSMEGLVSDSELETLGKFYTETAQYAQSKGVTISVISIAGEHVNMENLGRLADQTQGDVNIVDPVQLTSEFADILQSKTIATNVEATFHLHKGLCFSDLNDEDQHDLANNCVTRVVGNAYEETELTFEFIVKEGNAEKILDTTTNLPFQVAVKYTLPNGLEGLRVITQSKDLTDDQEEAEQDIDLGIMGMHNNWRSAKLAEVGDYDAVIQNNYAVQNLMRRNIQDIGDRELLSNYTSDANIINSHVRNEQRQMNSTQRRGDITSNTIYQFKNRKRNAKAYKKKR